MTNVKAVAYSGNIFKGTCNIGEFVCKRLDEIYGSGAVEDAEHKIAMLTDMVAFIVAGLSKEDQVKFVDRFGANSWEVVGE